MTKFSFAVASILMSASAQSAVVFENNIQLNADPGFADFELLIFQDAAATDPTSIFFDFDSAASMITFVTANIDEGSEWYFADQGEEFSAATIGSLVVFASLDNPSTVNMSFETESPLFHLGVNTGLGDGSGGEFDRSVFGWVLLENTGSDLELVESAVTYDQPGIVVGTLETVPEPSSVLLLSFGGLACLLRRRR